MPYYQTRVTVPANTSEDAPKIVTWKLTKGVIVSASVGFPAGSAGLAHAKIRHEEAQLWPTNPAEDFSWDDHVFRFTTYFELYIEPYQLKLICWNTSTTYSHTILFTVNILPKWLAAPYLILKGFVDAFRRLIGLPPIEEA